MKRWWLAPFILLSGWALVVACGPDFVTISADRAAQLRRPVPFSLAESLQAMTLPSSLAPALREKLRAQAVAQNNNRNQSEPEQRWREARAQASKSGSPSVPLYEAAALDFREHRWKEAAAGFSRVLKLPIEQSRPRAIWAAYSLGRTPIAGDANAAFARTRDLLMQGADDPLGLALDSLGEQAALRLHGSEDARIEALQFYFEQARLGSYSGMASLLQLQREWLDKEPALLRRLLLSDWGQALLLRLTLADDDAAERKGGLGRMKAALASHQTLFEPGHWAALAWNAGEPEQAATFAAQTSQAPIDAALRHWTLGKLDALHGHLDSAAGHYSAALQLLHLSPLPGYLPYDVGGTQLDTPLELRGEASALALIRGDFPQALAQLVEAGDTYAQDAQDIADKVLTVAELQRFVDARPASTSMGKQLRHVLARRLMREGQFDTALPYFSTRHLRSRWDNERDVEVQETLDLRELASSYALSTGRAHNALSSVGRAAANLQAGQLARDDGMELMGFALTPDDAIHEGSLLSFFEQDLAGMGERTETRRRGQALTTQAMPEGRAVPLPALHYRYVAVEHALRAAKELPPRSQAYAVALCKAAAWAGARDPDLRAAIYERYLKTGAFLPWGRDFGSRCPAPDWGGAQQMVAKQWLGKNFSTKAAVGITVAALAVLALFALAWARRRKA